MAEEEKVDFDSFTLISTSDEGGGGVGGLVDKFQMGKEWLQKKQSGIQYKYIYIYYTCNDVVIG